MLVGIYARRTSLITPENQQKHSGIVVNIAYPAIILSGALAEGERIEGTALLEATAAAFATLALAAAGGVLISRLLRIEARMRGVFVVMTIFTNIGFMGVPMVRGIYGADALIYMTVFLIPVNLFFFSYAVAAIRGDKLTLGEGRFLAVLRQLCNNGMIACVLAILFYFVDLPVPAPIRGTVEMLGSMTAPLAMLLMGSFLVDVTGSKACAICARSSTASSRRSFFPWSRCASWGSLRRTPFCSAYAWRSSPRPAATSSHSLRQCTTAKPIRARSKRSP